MKKEIKVKIDTTRQYLQIFNGILKLTDRELTILAKFLDKYYALNDQGIDPFSAPVKKAIAEELNVSDFNTLNIYIKSLKEKGAIRKNKGTYQFSNAIIKQPEEEGVTFVWQTNKN